jgi:hypothetical protein
VIIRNLLQLLVARNRSSGSVLERSQTNIGIMGLRWIRPALSRLPRKMLRISKKLEEDTQQTL